MFQFQLLNLMTGERRMVAAVDQDAAQRWCGAHEEVNGYYILHWGKVPCPR